MTERIRVLAMALISRDGDVLVERGRDDVKREDFYRLPGGGVDFGETGEEALRRELREELGVDIDELRYLRTLENIFTYEGKRGHEICRIYECVLRDPELYRRDQWETREDVQGEKRVHHLAWMPRDEFVAGPATLYPDRALG